MREKADVDRPRDRAGEGRTDGQHGAVRRLHADLREADDERSVREDRVVSGRTSRRAIVPSRREPYVVPRVRDGGELALPESRPDVITRILQRLDEASGGPTRQDYSNGEFVSSSLILGRTLAQVADRRMDLEAAGHTAHWDPKLGLWWRRGGSWD